MINVHYSLVKSHNNIIKDNKMKMTIMMCHKQIK